MYKPAKIRQFNTLAIHKKVNGTTVINGRSVKTYGEVGRMKGLFKLKGTSEITANGLTVINDKTTYTTWFNSRLESDDILEIKGVDYQIKGTPENTELRGRYSVINLEKIEGGA